MIWLIIIAALLIIWLISQNTQSASQKRNVNVQGLLDSSDNYYDDVQEHLQKQIDNGQHLKSDTLFGDLLVFYHAYQELFALWRKHVVTIVANDNNTIEAKITVASSWLEFLIAEKRVNDAIEVGINQDTSMRSRNTAQNTLSGIMEAYGYDLDKEYKEVESKYRKYFGRKPKTTKKRTAK